MRPDFNWFQLKEFVESHVSSLLNHTHCITLQAVHPSFSWTFATTMSFGKEFHSSASHVMKNHLHFFALNLHSTCLSWWSLLHVLEEMRNCQFLSLLHMILTSMYVTHIPLLPSCVFPMLKYLSLFQYSTNGSCFIPIFICFAFLRIFFSPHISVIRWRDKNGKWNVK